MSEHKIRLRAGWIWERGEVGEHESSMVTLPINGLQHNAGECQLTRSFGRPRVGAEELLVLKMEHVWGVLAATLNGVRLPGIQAGELEFVITSELLAERNRLVLEVDWEQARAFCDRDWGIVALLIRSSG